MFEFFNRMDRSAIRAVLISAGLFVAAVLILVIGRAMLMSAGEGEGAFGAMQSALIALRDHPAGLPLLILIFCACAFIGAPQFALIALAVAAFGPVRGMAYAWIAVLCSMSVTFWFGRFAGEATVRRYGGETLNRLARFVGENDFFASMIVRNLPTAPFIIVNMAFGVSRARYWRFLAGGAIGVLPKLSLVAFGGQAVMAALGGNLWLAVLAAVLAFAVWAVLVVAARKRVAGLTDAGKAPAPAEEMSHDQGANGKISSQTGP